MSDFVSVTDDYNSEVYITTMEREAEPNKIDVLVLDGGVAASAWLTPLQARTVALALLGYADEVERSTRGV